MSAPARTRRERLRSAGRHLARVLASLALLAVVVALTLRWSDSRSHLVIAVAALVPYLVLPALGATAALWWLRARPDAALGALLTLILLWTQSAVLFPSFSTHRHPMLTVMTVNLHLGQADPDAVVAAITREHADVVMLEELTPAELLRLQQAGAQRALPYMASRARAGASGVALLSRYPLTDVGSDDRFFLGFLHARLLIDGRPGPLVAAVHISGPYPQDATGWRSDLHRLGPALRRLTGEQPGGIVIGGDFNATRDNAPFRAALGGLRDAPDLSGQPLVRTYPAGGRLPALIDIDHILSDRPVAREVRTVTLPGSDHHALVADIALR